MKVFVARNKNGELNFFRNQPVKCAHNNEKNASFWADVKDEDYYLDLDVLFSDVQWENEPLEIELLKQSNDNSNQDSRQTKKLELIRLIRSKMEQYEAQLAKQGDNVACDDVDWVMLSSDMLSLLQKIQKNIII